MPSEQELSSKLAYANGKLTAGGDSAYMKKWYMEYKQHHKALQELRVANQIASEDRGEASTEDNTQKEHGQASDDSGSKLT